MRPIESSLDCGYKPTYRAVMKRLEADPNIAFELMVLTHIDGDHIAGAVPFIADGRVTPSRVKEVWFNGREQIDDTLGARQAEYFTRELESKGFNWNTRFDRRAILVPDHALPEPVDLDGGMRLTLLSPGPSSSRACCTSGTTSWMKSSREGQWTKCCSRPRRRFSRMCLGNPASTSSRRVRSSRTTRRPTGAALRFLPSSTIHSTGIVTRVPYFAATHSRPSLSTPLSCCLRSCGADRLRVDALKVSHHGSKSNTSMKMLELLKCRHFLFSTDGSRHSHPNPETIARIIKSASHPVDLHFNYLSDINKRWRVPTLKNKYHYDAHYPTDTDQGLVVEI
ncbi:MAG: hypothetical protein MZV65_21285 [Chromatiales bacterium]|nr:hypothetical protein [Chromatiales bacterium]